MARRAAIAPGGLVRSIPEEGEIARPHYWPDPRMSRKALDHVDNSPVWPYYSCMASPMIKSTYSLDPRTVRELERLARRFGTSKSEVLRRAVQSLARQEGEPEATGLQALDELQQRVGLTEERAEDWAEHVRYERAEMGRDRTDG